MSKQRTLGEVGDISDIGDVGDVGTVDMFGLDEFGQPAGIDSLWGAVIGGGVGTGAAILTRAIAKPESAMHDYSEAVGLLAGGLAGGVMMAFPASRRMGWAALATALVTNGLRQLETSLFAPKKEAAAEKPAETEAQAQTVKGWYGVDIEPAGRVPGGFGQDIAVEELGNGLGIVSAEPGYAVQGALGAVTPESAYPIPGSVSGAELAGPPSLQNAGDYGLSANPAVQQTQILGGPTVSGMGAHYGATLFGHTA